MTFLTPLNMILTNIAALAVGAAIGFWFGQREGVKLRRDQAEQDAADREEGSDFDLQQEQTDISHDLDEALTGGKEQQGG